MDYPLGQDATIPLDIRDRITGQPLVAGVTVGDWAVYGPASTTALLTGNGATHRGGAVYTVLVPTANLPVSGTYRLVYSVTAPADAVVTEDEVTFTVGPVVRGAWRMRDLLVSIIRGLGGIVRPSTLMNGVNITDPYWIGGGTILIPTEEFAGSEIVIIDPGSASTYADWFTGRVVVFDDTGGTFQVNRSHGLTESPSTRMYALTNINGAGFMFEHILAELQVAYDEVQPTVLASVSVGHESVANQFEYSLPDNLVSVASVGVREVGGRELYDDVGGYWEYLGDRRLLRLDEGLGLGAGHNLRIVGGVRCELPRLGGGWTDMPGVWLRERVRFGLLSSSPSPAHQRTAQVVYANLLRMPNPHRPHQPGERRLR